MINVIEGDDGVRMLDVDAYLNTFQKIRISKDLTLQVGKFTVDDIAKTKALGQEFLEKQKQSESDGQPLDEAEVFANLIDQLMIVLKRENPTLERNQLEHLPPAAINGIFKFVLKEGMGLGEGHGSATVEAVKTATTSASV
jgi:hypothetical protein